MAANGSAPAARPNPSLRPEGALLSFPAGRAPSPPFSFVPHCAQRSGGPFYLIDSGRPTQGLPASDAALAARPRWAVAASPPKRERAAGAVQERTRQGHRYSLSYTKRERAPGPPQSRHFCGNAVRHRTAGRRDLTGEPCSPVNPFFLDGGLWLGEGASRKTLWGAGAHFSFRQAKELLGPDDFSLVPPGGTISF